MAVRVVLPQQKCPSPRRDLGITSPIGIDPVPGVERWVLRLASDLA